MELACPNCSSPLQSAFYEGVSVHMCTGCHGVLLGKNNLQEIARKRDKIIPRNTPAPRRVAEAVLQCPRCRVPMKKGKYGKLRETTFDMCEKCSSLWLDRGELESIQMDFEMVSDNQAKSQAAAVDDAQDVQVPRRPGMAESGRRPPESSAGSGDSGGFKCPKCAHPQPRGDTCTRCGIVFAKYEAFQQERATQHEQSAAMTARVEECFRQIRGFDVQQQYHLTEAIIGFERANRYTVQPVGGSNVGTWQVEESNRSGLSILGRNLFGTLYTFTMQVLDETRNRILLFERRARFYFYQLDVFDETGREIGFAHRRFSLFNRVVTVHDDDGRELVRIIGPFFSPWTFLLRRQAADAGTIVKKWSGGLKELYTDADRFSMRFESNLDTRMRRLLLGAMMLIDSLYFEGRKPFVRHFFDAPGVQIIVVIALVGFLLGTPDFKLIPVMDTPPAAAQRSGSAIRQTEFLDLFERRRPLSALAVTGQYTVVEVYLDSCAICRQLESGFRQFTAKRPDVLIQRVHVPERGIMVESDNREARALMESICGTPHVEVYGPDKRPLAVDVCGDKSGTRFLRNWIAAETVLSVLDLQTSSGADASTPVPGMN